MQKQMKFSVGSRILSFNSFAIHNCQIQFTIKANKELTAIKVDGRPPRQCYEYLLILSNRFDGDCSQDLCRVGIRQAYERPGLK